MKVLKVVVEELENAGCNNGNYPEYEITMENGEVWGGMTCACGRGCNGMDRLPKVGDEFEDFEAFKEMEA